MCLAMALMSAVAIATSSKAFAGTNVKYITRSWDDTNKRVVEGEAYADCQELTDIPGDGYVLTGWYIARSFSDGDRPKVQGTANIIIENGREMSLRDGIEVPPGSTLNIYTNVWDDGTKDIGKLYVGRSKADTAAIGGNSGQNSGTINIYGAIIDVRGGSHTNHGGAGIGGGWKGSGTVNIYGGSITAKGGNEGAGIGGGSNKEGNDSTGGGSNNIKIYGGNVTAEGWYGAGIGGGEYGKGGIIQILGGNVSATGGADAAGIGGGEERDGGNITISGGTVNAKGGSVTSKGGAGIGGGGNGGSGTINISGGAVNATGGAFASGIGGGDEGEGKNITISGGNVTAIGNTQNSNGGGGAAGIGGGDKAAGKNITISGGTVSATGGTKLSVNGGAGIGGGTESNGEDITISGSANITKAQGGADAAGIGGGSVGEGKNIKITGGKVNAHGGSDKDGGGAGIGGGQKQSGTVTVTGGTITATGGGDGAGIGGGEKGAGGTITISGGDITSNGGDAGAGIGGGQDGNGGTITISGGTVKATGGKCGAGIGGGDEGESSGTILINGTAKVTAKGGEYGAGIGGGDKGGKAGSVTIDGGTVTATGGNQSAGIGTGRWSHTHGDSYYQSAVGVTINGGTVNAYGNNGGAGIGGGSIGTSGVIKINGGSIYAKGGKNGGSGIGTGDACFHDGITTVNITIMGGTIKAIAGEIDGATNSWKDDPGAAIGAGGTAQEASIGNATYESYFTGDIWLSGGTIEAYSADVSKSSGTKADTLNVIGTTDASSRDWQGDKGVVHFNGATVDMYPGAGSPNGAIKQMVKAADTSEGGILFTDDGGLYQRVTYVTQNGSVNKMKEAKDTSRYVVLTGAEGAEDFEGTKEQTNYYKRVRVESVHMHDFTYTLNAQGNTITAVCDNNRHDCPLTNETAVLTIAAPTLKTYRQTGDGISAEAVVTDEGHIRNGAQVQYYKANEAMTEKLTDEYGSHIKLEQAPTIPGKYWAEITLGKEATGTAEANLVTAHVAYEIKKAQGTSEVLVEKNQSINLTDTIKEILPINDSDYNNTTVSIDPSSSNSGCSMSDDGVTFIAGPTPGDVTVNVSVKDTNDLETMRAQITVKVIEKKPQVIEAEDMIIVLGETGKKIEANVTTPATGAGALTYAVKADEYAEVDPNNVIDVNTTTGELTVKGLGSAYVTVTAPAVDVEVNGEVIQYATTTKNVKVTVSKKLFQPTVTISGWTYGEYSASVNTPVLEEGSNPGGGTVTFMYKAKDASDEYYDEAIPTQAGDYVVCAIVDETSDYASATSAPVEFSIAKKPINVTVTAQDKEYDGTTEATISASVDDTALATGDSIEIDGIGGIFVNKNAGEGKLVAVDTSGMTIYGDNAESYELTIPDSTTATITKAWAVVMADDQYVPKGTELPELTATDYTPVEGEQIASDLRCGADNQIPGAYEIVVTADPQAEANSNYDIWCINGTLTVTMPITVTAEGYTGTYDGNPHGISVTAIAPDAPSIDGNYADLTAADWLALAEWAEYLGLYPDGLDGSSDLDAWVAWANSVNLKQVLNDLQWVNVFYGTEELTADNFLTAGTTTSPTFTNVGTNTVYYFVVALDGQTNAGSKDVVISEAEPTFTAPTPKQGLRYNNGNEMTLIDAGSATGGTMEYSLDGTNWSTELPKASLVGSYAVLYRVVGDENHSDTAPMPVTVTIAKALEPGVVIDSWTYGSPAKTPVFTDGVKEVDSSLVSYSYKKKDANDSTYSSEKPTKAGDYVVRAVVSETYVYTGTYTADFSVERKPLTATVIANDKTYDGTTNASALAFIYDGVLDGDSVSVSGVSCAFEDANAGELKTVVIDPASAVISGTGSENYAVTIPDTTVGTINKAQALIAADDVSITVGEPVPEPLKSYVYTAVKGEQLVYSLTCDTNGAIGEYIIDIDYDPSVVPNSNYEILCIPGKLTIGKASLSVTATGFVGAYDGAEHGVTVTVAPESAGAKVYYSAERELNAENCQIAGSLINPTFTNAGTYRVYYSVVAPDYEPISGFKDVVIGKADPSFTAPKAKSLAYTGSSQALIEAGSADGGTMEYSLDGETWSTNVPTASTSGSYAVLYRVTGDANHNNVSAKPVSSTIGTTVSTEEGGMFRLYNPNSGEHFYTASSAERDSLTAVGWSYEGIGWRAPEISNTPVYRLYNSIGGEHHYTTSIDERDSLVAAGWTDEGIGWYSDDAQSVPIYREYNPNAFSNNHNYTKDYAEHTWLLSIGWNDEGVAWYGL